VENSNWWISHLWVIAVQIIAFIPYFVGSWRFYRGKNGFLALIGLGIILDAIIAFAASSGLLPRMREGQGAPWHSVLFLLHITTAGLGMFGFIILFIYVLVKGGGREYKRLRVFQYKVLLRLWCLGVIIALANFICKVAFGIRVYDYF